MNTERLESLVQKVRAIEDPVARDAALELVQAVMDLHSAGLERMMEIVAESSDNKILLKNFSEEPGISSILLLHDFHPLNLEARVRAALEYQSLQRRGVSAELVSVRAGVVHLQVEGGAAYEALVQAAVAEAAPDAVDIVIEPVGVHHSSSFVPLTQLFVG